MEVAAAMGDGDTLEVILALDSKDGYWRRDLFPPYKADRIKKRQDDGVDWGRAYQEFDKLAETLAKYTPWKVLRVSKCEVDDIIYTLSTVYNEPSIIYSGDSDYLQLVDDVVSLYIPHIGEYAEFPLSCKISGSDVFCQTASKYLDYAILTGQGGKDNVYNVKTPADWDVTCGKRKPGFGAAAARKVLESRDVVAKLKSLGLWDNYKRNAKLIDMREIPNEYFYRILDAYRNCLAKQADMSGLLSVYDWPSLVADAAIIDAELTMLAEGVQNTECGVEDDVTTVEFVL